MKIFIETFGWIGMALILAAYALTSYGFLEPTAIPFQLMNLIGGVGLLIHAFSKKDYPPGVLNVIWSAIAIIAILRGLAA